MRGAACWCLFLLLLTSGCAGRPTGGPDSAAEAQRVGGLAAGRSPGASSTLSSQYLQLVDGLHVTGIPVEVDIADFRLRIGGAVERPLELSIGQIRALPAVREQITLDCPGFFTDRGTWTGVAVRDLLALAGVRPGAKRVVFTSLSQGYSSTLSLEEAQSAGVLVAYEFEGQPFAPVHGYPLRLTAKDHPGSVWVKWLGEIQLSE